MSREPPSARSAWARSSGSASGARAMRRSSQAAPSTGSRTTQNASSEVASRRPATGSCSCCPVEHRAHVVDLGRDEIEVPGPRVVDDRACRRRGRRARAASRSERAAARPPRPRLSRRSRANSRIVSSIQKRSSRLVSSVRRRRRLLSSSDASVSRSAPHTCFGRRRASSRRGRPRAGRRAVCSSSSSRS